MKQTTGNLSAKKVKKWMSKWSIAVNDVIYLSKLFIIEMKRLLVTNEQILNQKK